MALAKDIMRRDVITVSPEMSVEELGRLFLEKNISGAPVLDKDGMLFGIVTENDLISKNKRLHIPTILRLFDAYIPLGRPSVMEKELSKMTALTVGEICTRDVFTVEEDAPVEEVATIMTEKRVHLVPVAKDRKVIGIIGRHEIIMAASAGE